MVLTSIILQAAAVLDVGAVAQSPSAKMFLYLTCCSVCLSTATKFESSTSGQFHRTEGVDIGGVTCSIEYYTDTYTAELTRLMTCY